MAGLRSQLVPGLLALQLLGLLALQRHGHHCHPDHLHNGRRSWAVLLLVVAVMLLPLGLVPLLVLEQLMVVLEQLMVPQSVMLLLLLPLAQGERPQPEHAQQPQSRHGHVR